MISLAGGAVCSPTADHPTTAGDSVEEGSGILLYYKYVSLTGTAADDVSRWYEALCKRLDLNGRVRVARDGVNVTVGGSMAALRSHAAAVVAHQLLRGGDIDFKLAPSRGSRNEATRHETKMDKLVVRLCEELVTLGPLARNRADPKASTAPHLTPEQFHDMLRLAADAAGPDPQAALKPQPMTATAGPMWGSSPAQPSEVLEEAPGDLSGGSADPQEARRARPGLHENDFLDGPSSALEAAGRSSAAGGAGNSEGEAAQVAGQAAAENHCAVVLLDARNIYETRIGHFDAGPSVATLDPRTRCFSDLPAWLDEHAELLRNRTVLMYCTGGVRCERASAYLREKGPEFQQVFQLSGGIQRYLERFRDGGFFRGKNFLYDDRIAVGPEDVPLQSPGTVVGRCLLCDCPWDDYGARLRCSRCRLLLLVCDACVAQQGLRPQPDHQLTTSVFPGASTPAAAVTATAMAGEQEDNAVTREQRDIAKTCDTVASGDAAAAACGIRHACSSATSQCVQQQPQPQLHLHLLCELCRDAWEGSVHAAEPDQAARPVGMCGQSTTAAAAGDATAATAAATGSSSETGGGPRPPERRLRILCLHGFRQTGRQFQGRTCALRKKLRDLADFVFVDAPHVLPLFIKAAEVEATPEVAQTEAVEVEATPEVAHTEAVEVEATPEVAHTEAVEVIAVESEPKPEAPSEASEPDSDVGGGGAAGSGFEAPELPHPDPTGTAGDPAGQALRREPEDIAGNLGTTSPTKTGGQEAATISGLEEKGQDEGEHPAEVARPRGTEGQHEGRAGAQLTATPQPQDALAVPPAAAPVAAAKCAWLLPPELHPAAGGEPHAMLPEGEDAPTWRTAPSYVDELQYTRQKEGWDESLAALERAVRELGPFDGVFGFSQGAAIAVILCALQQQHRQQQQQHPQDQQPQDHVQAPPTAVTTATATSAAAATPSEGSPFNFRFAILASGFPSPVPEHRELLASIGPIEIPSLHVYGCAAGSAAGGDRQIPPNESELLAGVFSCRDGLRRVLRHQCGHLIPATRSHAATFRSFLQSQLG